jgi:hypothetical protein
LKLQHNGAGAKRARAIWRLKAWTGMTSRSLFLIGLTEMAEPFLGEELQIHIASLLLKFFYGEHKQSASLSHISG